MMTSKVAESTAGLRLVKVIVPAWGLIFDAFADVETILLGSSGVGTYFAFWMMAFATVALATTRATTFRTTSLVTLAGALWLGRITSTSESLCILKVQR